MVRFSRSWLSLNATQRAAWELYARNNTYWTPPGIAADVSGQMQFTNVLDAMQDDRAELEDWPDPPDGTICAPCFDADFPVTVLTNGLVSAETNDDDDPVEQTIYFYASAPLRLDIGERHPATKFLDIKLLNVSGGSQMVDLTPFYTANFGSLENKKNWFIDFAVMGWCEGRWSEPTWTRVAVIEPA